MLEVKDGDRTLQFNGTLLGESSSRRSGSNRWIEFKLYKTDAGSYILSRIGVSIIFHGPACYLVNKYDLIESFSYELGVEATPCENCMPEKSLDLVFPEQNRYWALITEDPKAILNSLYKKGEDGSKYLTYVAQDLLESASKSDSSIKNIYKIEVIP